MFFALFFIIFDGCCAFGLFCGESSSSSSSSSSLRRPYVRTRGSKHFYYVFEK